jgi:sRNA-binding protein
MIRARLTPIALTLTMLAAGAHTVRADVRADEKAKVEFAGMLGRMFNLFGGKGAREGVTSVVAVKGDRKATLNETTGQIIDLAEEKVYDLDLRKKTYKVTTFDELRRQMEEAKQKAGEQERKEQAEDKTEKTEKTEKPSPSADEKQPQVEVDFDVKNTGQAKTINGYDTHESVMTITVREKGKTLEEGGGTVLTSDMWLGPQIPAMKEIADFDMRYAQKLYGAMIAGVSPEQMAQATAMYPGMKQALGRMNAEGTKLSGTAIQTVTTMDAVKSAAQMAEEAKAKQDDSTSSSASGGVGGMLGRFAAKKIQKKAAGGADASQPRATFMTITSEVLKVVTDVTPADVAVPDGFKQGR